MALEPETTKVADATVTSASETTSETTEASATAGASAMVPPWQNIGHEILETILKNAEEIKATFVKMGIHQDKVDSAARAIAESKVIDAVVEGIEHTRKRAKSAMITGDEMFAEMFPAFRRNPPGHKRPKKSKKSAAKKASKKAPEMPTDKAAKKGGENA
jgi:hypothetical protein